MLSELSRICCLHRIEVSPCLLCRHSTLARRADIGSARKRLQGLHKGGVFCCQTKLGDEIEFRVSLALG